MERGEFDGYVRRHEDDEDAHGRLIRRVSAERTIIETAFDARLTALERWQQRMIGGLAFGALMLGGGGIAAVIEFARH